MDSIQSMICAPYSSPTYLSPSLDSLYSTTALLLLDPRRIAAAPHCPSDCIEIILAFCVVLHCFQQQLDIIKPFVIFPKFSFTFCTPQTAPFFPCSLLCHACSTGRSSSMRGRYLLPEHLWAGHTSSLTPRFKSDTATVNEAPEIGLTHGEAPSHYFRAARANASGTSIIAAFLFSCILVSATRHIFRTTHNTPIVWNTWSLPNGPPWMHLHRKISLTWDGLPTIIFDLLHCPVQSFPSLINLFISCRVHYL